MRTTPRHGIGDPAPVFETMLGRLRPPDRDLAVRLREHRGPRSLERTRHELAGRRVSGPVPRRLGRHVRDGLPRRRRHRGTGRVRGPLPRAAGPLVRGPGVAEPGRAVGLPARRDRTAAGPRGRRPRPGGRRPDRCPDRPARRGQRQVRRRARPRRRRRAPGRLVAPALADWAVVALMDDAGRPRAVGRWHADPARLAALDELSEHMCGTRPGQLTRTDPQPEPAARRGARCRLPAGRPRPDAGRAGPVHQRRPRVDDRGRRRHGPPGCRSRGTGPGQRPPLPAAAPSRRGSPTQPADRAAVVGRPADRGAGTSPRPRRRASAGTGTTRSSPRTAGSSLPSATSSATTPRPPP